MLYLSSNKIGNFQVEFGEVLRLNGETVNPLIDGV